MKRILHISDMHLEHYKQPYQILECLIERICKFEINVVVIAGDFCYIQNSREYLNYLAGAVSDCMFFYVTGNHEFYHTSKRNSFQYFDSPDASDLPPNVKFMESSSYTFTDNSLAIVGLAPGIDGSWKNIYECLDMYNDYNDIKYIGDFARWKRYSKNSFDLMKRNIQKIRERNQNTKIIVVGHFLPSPELISLEYQGDILNHCYANDWTDYIMKDGPDYWFHGHSHDFMRKEIGDCVCVRNPMDYPSNQNNHGKKIPIDIIEV